MAKFITQNVVCLVFFMLVAIGGAQTPPGIAKNPSHASCKKKEYKNCYNLVHVCPKFCPDSCTVECASCKPICSGSTIPPPDSESRAKSPKPSPSPKPSSPKPRTPPPATPSTPTPSIPPSPTPTPPTSAPTTPSKPKPTPSSPTPVPPTPAPTTPPTPKPRPSSPTPKTPTPAPTSPPTPKPTPSSPTPTPPTPAPTTPATPAPRPSSHTPSHPAPAPATPSTPTPSAPSSPTPAPITPSTPTPIAPSSSTPAPPTPYPTTPSTPTPTTPSSPSAPTPESASSASAAKAKCKNQNYPQCYNVQHVCPSACPGGCEVDCVTCKPVCNCDKPGAVCQDPRFVGGDGITFYFHGKKDRDFCLVTDSNLHINAHFIGKRNQNMRRDFTWVQSIAILFDSHKFFIGAQKTATWDATIDHLDLSFNGKSIDLPETEGAFWQSESEPKASITRISNTDNVIIEVDGIFKITAKVVPITKQESLVHNYGITQDDSFAHLDLGFKFYSLSNQVNGVLGQTYRDDYVSRVNIGASMPVLGGDKKFATSSFFATDCSVALFKGSHSKYNAAWSSSLKLPSLRCSSNMNGKGVICKR